MTRTPAHRMLGFSLVEMAIVLLILALLLGGGLTVLSAQIEQQKFKDTQRLLDEAREALLGFAAANGRLPCPASATSNGIESPVGGGNCTNPFNGFLPAATLGLPGSDANGYLSDAWGLPQNRIRYAVTQGNPYANPSPPPATLPAATSANGIQTVALGTFGAATNTQHLYVCTSSTGITATNCGTATALSTNAAAVLISLGPNAPQGPGGTDETANLNGDRVFISHTPTATGATNGQFDDMVVWISPYTLIHRLIEARRLP